jgi:hypothetical protein
MMRLSLKYQVRNLRSYFPKKKYPKLAMAPIPDKTDLEKFLS